MTAPTRDRPAAALALLVTALASAGCAAKVREFAGDGGSGAAAAEASSTAASAPSSVSAETTTTGASPPVTSSGAGIQCASDADCANGAACKAFSCVSGFCDGTILAGEPCSAGGVICDAGGNCVDCLDASSCEPSEACVNGRCQAAPGCENGSRDGAETDVDCGGGACAPCASGKGCELDSDCAGGSCEVDLCQ